MPRIKDLTGMKFERLTVICRKGIIDGHAAWLCMCECGNTAVIKSTYLIKGKTKSCGCLHKDMLRARSITHNQSKTRLYRIWGNMISRCENPKVACYPYYGGRGIKIAPEWKTFVNFQKWSCSNGYSDNLTIDRIDTNGNYEPSNCRWTDMATQSRNRRKRGTALCQ